MNCGQCGQRCLFGTRLGACCSGVCADTQTDNSNCGACDRFCPAGSICCGGRCIADVFPTSRLKRICCNESACTGELPGCCSGACVDLASDPRNCGACGMICPIGTCARGQCACGPNFPCTGGQVCAVGTCVTTCPSGQTDCNGLCADLRQTHPTVASVATTATALAMQDRGRYVRSSPTAAAACARTCRPMRSIAASAASGASSGPGSALAAPASARTRRPTTATAALAGMSAPAARAAAAARASASRATGGTAGAAATPAVSLRRSASTGRAASSSEFDPGIGADRGRSTGGSDQWMVDGGWLVVEGGRAGGARLCRSINCQPLTINH
jgi:stigma-specific protein Stig1